MDQTKVSINITANNCEKYIPASIQSILIQSLQDFKLNNGDDGSNGLKSSILKEFLFHHDMTPQNNFGSPATSKTQRESLRGYCIHG